MNDIDPALTDALPEVSDKDLEQIRNYSIALQKTYDDRNTSSTAARILATQIDLTKPSVVASIAHELLQRRKGTS